MNKKFSIDPNERFDMHNYLDFRRYSYVAKLARLSPHGSMQKIFEGFFPRNWEKDDKRLSERLRKLGCKDSEFYPPGLQRRMGIKVKAGRRRKNV